MRKLLFFLVLFMSIHLFSTAGYIIRGITTWTPSENLKNYTLTFDASGTPIAAGSMYTSLGPGTAKNSIVIVNSASNIAEIFPIALPVEPNADYNIEVRDIHYVSYRNIYVLCGSRGVGNNTNAFVAFMSSNFSSMEFIEYPEANIFYSIWADFVTTAVYPYFGYYACGTNYGFGVIAHINPLNMQLLGLYETDLPWEYHKIILQQSEHALRFVVSGRDPSLHTIGLTEFAPAGAPTTCYYWSQSTNPASHCVVADYVLANNRVVVASSNGNIITLNSAIFPLSFIVDRYRYTLRNYPYNVQDIGAIVSKEGDFSISVAGYMERGLQNHAWHGYVTGLSTAIPMSNNNYFRANTLLFENYKIRYDNNGKLFTGGYYQSNTSMCAQFGTPLTTAYLCDDPYRSLNTEDDYDLLYQFPITAKILVPHTDYTKNSRYYTLSYYDDYTPFKGGNDPEYSMLPPENETEITNFYDRITVKEIPSGTNYQIYSVTGQLIQTGTTNPDISTAQLSKGMYILRLESGKVVKFVK